MPTPIPIPTKAKRIDANIRLLKKRGNQQWYVVFRDSFYEDNYRQEIMLSVDDKVEKN